ncbi:MAG: hypothetical protein HFK08_03355 [Clostridia bacterium]|jgi:hypothetical protein|nr:hypothetical protein [Clostridia bacterium]
MEYAAVKTLTLGGELADVRLYGFEVLGEIDLKEEMTGGTSYLVDAALHSLNTTAVYGAHFRLNDLDRFSLVTFHDGMLADVADCTLHFSGEELSTELKVYGINGVNIGIAVDDDIDSETVWRKLSEKADAVVAVTRSFDAEREKRVGKLHEAFGLPAVVKCGNELYSFGAEETIPTSRAAESPS